MALYVDSSVLVGMLKNEPCAAQASVIWSQHSNRVSSMLFEIECLIALRRNYFHLKTKLPEDWLSAKEAGLAVHLAEIELKKLDEEVTEIIKREPGLAQCRSSDAIHVATALLFQQVSPNDFTFFTFDERQAAVAKAVGLKVQS